VACVGRLYLRPRRSGRGGGQGRGAQVHTFILTADGNLP
jgi:hypothetical protein